MIVKIIFFIVFNYSFQVQSCDFYQELFLTKEKNSNVVHLLDVDNIEIGKLPHLLINVKKETNKLHYDYISIVDYSSNKSYCIDKIYNKVIYFSKSSFDHSYFLFCKLSCKDTSHYFKNVKLYLPDLSNAREFISHNYSNSTIFSIQTIVPHNYPVYFYSKNHSFFKFNNRLLIYYINENKIEVSFIEDKRKIQVEADELVVKNCENNYVFSTNNKMIRFNGSNVLKHYFQYSIDCFSSNRTKQLKHTLLKKVYKSKSSSSQSIRKKPAVYKNTNKTKKKYLNLNENLNISDWNEYIFNITNYLISLLIYFNSKINQNFDLNNQSQNFEKNLFQNTAKYINNHTYSIKIFNDQTNFICKHSTDVVLITVTIIFNLLYI